MGFHLRKSFKCGPIRFNLSNSGIGASVGVKGARVGIDGKGRTYVGGGVGMLRYREYSGNSNGDEMNNSEEEKGYISIIDNEIPEKLKSMSKGLKIFCSILYFPISLIFLVYSFPAFMFKNAPSIIWSLFSLFFSIFPYYKMWFSTKSHNALLAKKAIDENNKLNYQEALNLFIELKEKGKKLDYDSHIWISEKILKLYEKIKDFENELEFLQKESFINNRRVRIAKCLYKLEKWQELINYLQKEFTQEEKQEHPSYYALLADAFLNNNQKEIALETLLQGPVTKRSMNTEMCAFRYSLGKCYEANGDLQNALKQYQKIYSFDAEFEGVAEKIQELTNKE